MKRIISMFMVFVFVISVFTVSSSAMSIKAPQKYTKVKTTTLKKYKKAYKENVKLKKQIQSLQSTSDAKDKVVISLKSQLAAKQEKLDSANSMNSWIWNNVKSMGISYKSKVWTIPSEFPEKFIIDGATYRVVLEE